MTIGFESPHLYFHKRWDMFRFIKGRDKKIKFNFILIGFIGFRETYGMVTKDGTVRPRFNVLDGSVKVKNRKCI